MRAEIATLTQNPDQARGQAIAAVARVQRVPFKLGLDGDPHKLFRENVGNCTRKGMTLIPQFRRRGYRVTIGIAEFNWEHLAMIPREIVRLLKDPTDTHLFLNVSDGTRTMRVDPAWDPHMRSLGFAVSEWDGIHDMPLGVPATAVRDENELFLRARSWVSTARRSLLGSRPKPMPFSNAFNEWIGR